MKDMVKFNFEMLKKPVPEMLTQSLGLASQGTGDGASVGGHSGRGLHME
jgi:hypothetical protein